MIRDFVRLGALLIPIGAALEVLRTHVLDGCRGGVKGAAGRKLAAFQHCVRHLRVNARDGVGVLHRGLSH